MGSDNISRYAVNEKVNYSRCSWFFGNFFLAWDSAILNLKLHPYIFTTITTGWNSGWKQVFLENAILRWIFVQNFRAVWKTLVLWLKWAIKLDCSSTLQEEVNFLIFRKGLTKQLLLLDTDPQNLEIRSWVTSISPEFLSGHINYEPVYWKKLLTSLNWV